MLDEESFLFFTDRALDGMTAILAGLGDELASTRLPGANTPYAIVNHCLGVIAAWAGQVVAGRTVHRDREAEFTAAGPIAPLLDRVARARERLREDVAAADFDAPQRGEVPDKYATTPAGRRQGAALVHVYEELAQHHGQLELTRDILLASVRS
ncbi:DUF664 domain-containing protein [Amycolatopsis methanolica]|uniref:DUF664 domain-containing protein n=1 Tax=Amycolatopsis methanolica 239 TaxID=1068978 RepID=A0A076N0D3_AMYME|nr:DUF664 domain-containing protein [Amycolatopsis methanolica]AIJ24310.1 hypothetical protein AMETH_4218 [Amycolatopsis methanolica 239]